MNSKKIKAFVKVVIEVLLLVIMVLYASRVLERKDTYIKYEGFFRENNDFDVLFFGSSNMEFMVNPLQLWNEYGITSYNFGNTSERLPVTYWTIKNALEYSSPKVVVIEVSQYGQTEKYKDMYSVHNAWDRFPLTLTKIEAVYDVLSPSDPRQELLFDFILYHDRWSELTEDDFSNSYSKLRGFAANSEYTVFERPEYEYRIDMAATETEGVMYLEKAVEELQEKGIQVVFVHSPEVNSEEKQARINAASVTAEKYNIPFIDFTVMEDSVVDYATDMFDSDHVNIQGATKLTHYLGEYLTHNYGLESHAEDDSYDDWNTSYDQFNATHGSVVLKEVKPDIQ
ncbi:hypothetical protein [Butyrivibrio sp. TB]|uniref:hypothetical protein n=1 Tax=Butyrivibrio sp. TB TaxID=1520809 RepID=UPI0008AC7B11|nr:hypothetical protein [Butyrivibrio sp. TB]SEQ36651.1 hypothetical protein SAMN02910382_02787 [Butyrivibrio sp. TB]